MRPKKSSPHRSSLFVFETIISLVYFSFACYIFVQLLLFAYLDRRQARDENHLQTLIVTTSEAFEGWNGDAEEYAHLLMACHLEPEVVLAEDYEGPADDRPIALLTLRFDKAFSPCGKGAETWRAELALSRKAHHKTLDITFHKKDVEGVFQLADRFHVSFPWAGTEEGGNDP